MTDRVYKINIVILNYNGKELFPKYLPGIIEASRQSRHDCRVTVLDNCSTDGSVEFLAGRFGKAVEVVRARENRVLCSYNELAEKSTDDILILLNNDIGVDPGFVDPLVERYDRDPDTFSVSARTDKSIIRMHHGTISADIAYSGYEARLDTPSRTLSTAMGVFDRKKFVELGGYDAVYLPGRYEDLDLSYRAWKRGWKCYYEPRSCTFHEGSVVFQKTFSEHQIQAMVFRNSMLFMVKNVTDPSILFRFYGFLILRLLIALPTARWHVFDGFFQALGRLPATFRSRQKARKHFRHSDEELFQWLSDPETLEAGCASQ